MFLLAVFSQAGGIIYTKALLFLCFGQTRCSCFPPVSESTIFERLRRNISVHCASETCKIPISIFRIRKNCIHHNVLVLVLLQDLAQDLPLGEQALEYVLEKARRDDPTITLEMVRGTCARCIALYVFHRLSIARPYVAGSFTI